MSKISLRLPYLIYLSIASMLVGVILAPLFRDMPVQGTAADIMAHEMMHGTLEIPAAGAPEVAISVEKDPMSGWNVAITTRNFTFAPELVNADNVENTGHAHLYVDGVKVARLYGPHHHLPDLPVGDREISVSLSANDHSYYVVEGDRIEARTVVTQDAMEMADGS